MHKLTIFEKLTKLIKNSEASSSNFLVSSIVIDKNKKEYQGVNVEYQIPTNGICAERNAISTAITNSMKIGDLEEVHVFARNLNNINENSFTPPCGVCRQVIYEVSNGKAKVFLYNSKGEVKKYLIQELLPMAFEGVEK
ncbi:MAG: cytidine deaminase [Candidatus Tyloplasma litorale]|nr:MAG: cytidine deaminase [Mycoplasmatales bacterium]